MKRAVEAAVRRLADAGVDSPRLDAELLLAFALGVDRAALVTGDFEVPASFSGLCARRAAREPVAYIVGSKGFRHISLEVDRRVLIPRPDTETLVEVALEALVAGERVHDVGTGSGAVALALKDEQPDLSVSGSDASPDAVEVARGNAARLGLDVEFEVARGLPAGAADSALVVANLPYVREDEWPGLEPELRDFEPYEALISGPDGLDAIRELVEQVPAGTRLALEHAPDQGEAVRALLAPGARTVRDLAGRDRVTIGTRP